MSALPGRVAGDIEACATHGLRGNDLNAVRGESAVLADLAVKPDFGGLADLVVKPGIRGLADSVASAGLPGKRGIGGFGRFGGKAGNRGVLADLELKGESTCLPENRRSPKGVPIFGKSVIRAICRESAICGCQRATGAMLLMMRLRCCGAGPSPVPVLLLEQSPWVLGSTDRIKADGGDGWGGLRGESFGGPVFSGDRGGNLARCRSWAVGRRRPKLAAGALSGRIWRARSADQREVRLHLKFRRYSGRRRCFVWQAGAAEPWWLGGGAKRRRIWTIVGRAAGKARSCRRRRPALAEKPGIDGLG